MNTTSPSRHLTREELISLESREIAREIIEKRLAESDLPLPKTGLDVHIDALIRVNTQITEIARARVEKRLDAYSQALKAIGIDSSPIESMEL